MLDDCLLFLSESATTLSGDKRVSNQSVHRWTLLLQDFSSPSLFKDVL